MNEIATKENTVIKHNPENREVIFSVQDRINELIGTHEAQPIDCPLKHHFVKGMYAREIFIPKGTLYVGKIHKHAHFRIISKGKVSIFTEEGEILMEAPNTMITPAGTKRVGFAHEDTVITTIHLTNETELDKIEEDIIAKDYDEIPYLENISLENKT